MAGLLDRLSSLLGLNLPCFSISIDTVIGSGLTPRGSWEGTCKYVLSCRVPTGVCYTGLAGPVLWAQPQSFQPTSAALPWGWDMFDNIHSFPKGSLWPAGFSGHPWKWWQGCVECLGTAQLRVLLAWLLEPTGALWTGCGTMCTLDTTLQDHLSSCFLWIGIMLPEASNKRDWIFPTRLRTTMTPKTQQLRSFWGPYLRKPLCGSQGWWAFLHSPSLSRGLLHPV